MNDGLINGLERSAPPEPALRQLGISSVAFLGDSLIANGLAGSVQTSTGVQNLNGLAWYQWAQLESAGRWLINAVQAQSGIAASTVRDRYLPAVLQDWASPYGIKPNYCVVLIGVNDASLSVPFTMTQKAMLSIWRRLARAGVEPILCTLTPRSSMTAGHLLISQWVRWYANRHGLKLLDFAAQSTIAHNNSGNWLSGLSDDNLHPNETGAKAMGSYVSAKFTEWGINQWTPPFASLNADTQNLYSTSNALLVTDTNADGVPDGWTISGTSATSALAAASTGLGNEMTLTSASANATLTSGDGAATAGSWVVMSARISSTVAGSAPSVQFAPFYGAFTYAFSAGISVPAGSVMSRVFWSPAARSQPWRLAITVGNGTVAKISQPSMFSLTALGIL